MTDKRVRVMNEIISGMRLIKMYAWEWAFHEYVKKIRKLVLYCDNNFKPNFIILRKESRIITQASMIQGINLVLYYSSLSLLSFTTFSTYAGLGNALSPKKVFTAITLFSFIRLYCIYFLVFAFLSLSELSVAIKRIEVSGE